jgi:hypothetical protein
MSTPITVARIREAMELGSKSVYEKAPEFIEALLARIDEIEGGLRPFAAFAQAFDAKPLRGIADEFYGKPFAHPVPSRC